MPDEIKHKIDPDAPLRLVDAVKIAFPMGGMTVSGLRKEIERGRLVVEMIAGKQFTTLANIEEMRRLCRVKPKNIECKTDNEQVSVSRQALRVRLAQLGGQSAGGSTAALDALTAKLNERKRELEAAFPNKRKKARKD